MSDTTVRLVATESEVRNLSGSTRASGKFVMRCEASSYDLLQRLHNRLSEGIEVDAAGDFNEALMNALRKENEDLEKKLSVLREDYETLRRNALAMRAEINELELELDLVSRGCSS